MKLKLADEYFSWIQEGRKKSTIRYGHRDIPVDRILAFQSIRGTEQVRLVLVKRIEYLKFGDLNENDAKLDGFESLSELKKALLGHYPTEDISDETLFTIVKFQLNCFR